MPGGFRAGAGRLPLQASCEVRKGRPVTPTPFGTGHLREGWEDRGNGVRRPPDVGRDGILAIRLRLVGKTAYDPRAAFGPRPRAGAATDGRSRQETPDFPDPLT
jgi:hypothetical protein